VVEDLIDNIYGELAAGRHGIARIDREIDQARLELGHVHLNRPEPCGPSHLNLDRFSEGALKEVCEPGQVIIEIKDFGIKRLAPREGKQAVCQCGSALDRG
jgi:hypothetical protein